MATIQKEKPIRGKMISFCYDNPVETLITEHDCDRRDCCGIGNTFTSTNKIERKNESVTLDLWGYNILDQNMERDMIWDYARSPVEVIWYVIYDVQEENSLTQAKRLIEHIKYWYTNGRKTPLHAVLIGYSQPPRGKPQARTLPEVQERERRAREYAEDADIPYASINGIKFNQSGEGELNAALWAGVDRYYQSFPLSVGIDRCYQSFPEETNKKGDEKDFPLTSNYNWSLLSFVRNPYSIRSAAPIIIGIPVGAITWAVLNTLGKNVTPFDTVGHSIGMGAGAGLAIGLILMMIKYCNNEPSYEKVPDKTQ